MDILSIHEVGAGNAITVSKAEGVRPLSLPLKDGAENSGHAEGRNKRGDGEALPFEDAELISVSEDEAEPAAQFDGGHIHCIA